MMRRVPLLLTALVAALLLASCGDDAPSTTTELSVTGTDELAFEPDAFAVPVGTEVTVEFTAEDAVEHDLVVEGAAMAGMTGEEGHGEDEEEDDHATDESDLHVAHADAGETATATFTIDEAGTYEVFCTVPGHREAGMVAELTVVEE